MCWVCKSRAPWWAIIQAADEGHMDDPCERAVQQLAFVRDEIRLRHVEPERPTEAKLRGLAGLFRRTHGDQTREDRLVICSRMLERRIHSLADVTTREMRFLFQRLMRMPGAWPPRAAENSLARRAQDAQDAPAPPPGAGQS